MPEMAGVQMMFSVLQVLTVILAALAMAFALARTGSLRIRSISSGLRAETWIALVLAFSRSEQIGLALRTKLVHRIGRSGVTAGSIHMWRVRDLPS
jgi:hypothetical protein